jgi:serine/threonine-protein kinase SRPK3
MSTILRRTYFACRRLLAPAGPAVFPESSFKLVPPSKLIEEETLDSYTPESFFPVQIGAVYHPKFQIVTKLGYGKTSTVWLARNLEYVISSFIQGNLRLK